LGTESVRTITGARRNPQADPKNEIQASIAALIGEHGRAILGLFILALVVHDVFGAHGFIAMRRRQTEINRVKQDIDRLNTENRDLSQQVKALKSDPHLIEKIAREELQHAKPGEVIIRIPQSQQPAPDSPVRP
jgi:cell division protein FtsL